MAKEGIPSFLLDCRTNDNISEIEAEYGVKGFAVVVRLWQKIYAEKGYYCEWIERSPLLFLSNWFGGNSGVTVSLINEIVKRCLNNGIFDAKMHEDYSILTSARIQEQYFDAVKRRKEILVKKEYLLVSVDKIEGVAYKNDVSVCINQKNVCRNGTREGKGSKGKVSKENNARTNISVERFEFFWCCYPLDKNRYLAEQAYIDVISDGIHTEDDLVEAAKNYAEYCKVTDIDKIYHADNFLKKCVFEDYLPGKYKKPASKKTKNSFKNFKEHDCDFDAIAARLIRN